MTNTKVLITGIAGSGGSYLADWLIENKSAVLSVHGIARQHSTSSKSEYVDNRKIIHLCDMNDFSSLFTIIDGLRPQYIFNFASFANVRASFDSPLMVLQNNIMSTANLFEVVRMLKRTGYNPRILHCSTSEVYGQVPEKDVPILEGQRFNPVNPYSVSKAAQDLLAQSYVKSYGLDIVITRMFTYLNARRNDLFATAFARQLLKMAMDTKESKVLKHGNLDSIRTIIDIRDACKAYYYAMRYGESGEIYNIGGETVKSVREVLFDLIDKIDVDCETEEVSGLFRPVDVTLQIPETGKFKRHTKWEPEFSYDDSLDYFIYEVSERIRNGY